MLLVDERWQEVGEGLLVGGEPDPAIIGSLAEQLSRGGDVENCRKRIKAYRMCYAGDVFRCGFRPFILISELCFYSRSFGN